MTGNPTSDLNPVLLSALCTLEVVSKSQGMIVLKSFVGHDHNSCMELYLYFNRNVNYTTCHVNTALMLRNVITRNMHRFLSGSGVI